MSGSERVKGIRGLAKVLELGEDFVGKKLRELGNGGLKVYWWRSPDAAVAYWEERISSPTPAASPDEETESEPVPVPAPRKRKPRKALDDAPLDLGALRAEYRAKPQ